ncbi:ATP-binding cassette domain-containing protein [Burkholderia multivorans]|uniref:ATP-binding cassette domain-containing protein n=1 Tax=Burkholderia multivorans TaxID=87883 RepID=UPI0021C10641|nr:ATP-binding cassette domain-containing protein [Burkholderia multivorans]
MIELSKLTKSYVTKGGRKYVFRDLSFVVPPDKNIALIGKNGAGKSTLMRLLCGTEIPDSGKIITDKRISWPVGLGGGISRFAYRTTKCEVYLSNPRCRGG